MQSSAISFYFVAGKIRSFVRSSFESVRHFSVLGNLLKTGKRHWLNFFRLLQIKFGKCTTNARTNPEYNAAYYIHGPRRRFRGDQNEKDTKTFCGKFLYNAIASTDNAQHKNCPSSGIDDRPGRHLFRVLKRSPISQPHARGLRRGYSDGKAVGNMTGLRRRLHPYWRISLLQSLRRALARLKQVPILKVLARPGGAIFFFRDMKRAL